MTKDQLIKTLREIKPTPGKRALSWSEVVEQFAYNFALYETGEQFTPAYYKVYDYIVKRVNPDEQ